MRTTVEITDQQRAKLLELAATRGEKGFSRLVMEAIDQYLAAHEARADKVRAAVAALGSLSDGEAEQLHAAVRATRERWR